MTPFVRRHPFTLLGLLSLTLLMGVEALSRSGHSDAAAAVIGPLRVLIVPMYLAWLPFTLLNVALARIDGLPAAVPYLIWICGLVAGLGPYALADHLLARWRARGHRTIGGQSHLPPSE